jgi:glutamyl-tRNA synthetase
MNTLSPVRVRFAPSPTGRTHLGSARTALYNYLLARQTGGKFIFRLEDTDQKRYVPGSEDELVDSLHWLGIQWDEGFDVGGPHAPYRQSLRREIYQHHARQLVEQGKAFYCFCTPERLDQVRKQQMQAKQNPRYDGACRDLDPDEAARRVARGEKHVMRFKMPREGSITVHDLLRGDITVENSSLDDSVLIKSDGLAVYHMAAMLDDYLMNISHVFRGAEWLPSFPLHGHILRAFGYPLPEFVHLSLFLKPSGKGKMSKRESAEFMQDGHSIFATDLRQLGYLPEAVVNWIALMGWSYDDQQEFFLLDELVKKFSLQKLNPSPAAINFTKLDHFNGLHIRNLAAAELAARVKPYLLAAGLNVDDDRLLQIMPLVRERLVTLDEIVQWAGFFFREQVTANPQDLIGDKMSAAQSAEAARQAYQVLSGLPDLAHATAEEPLRALAEQLALKPGQFFGILRVAVTGQKVSPPLFESMQIIGREKVLARIEQAIQALESM